MILEILPAVYPNKVSINFSAIIELGGKEYDAVIEAHYSAPDDAYDQEELFRDTIELVTLEHQARLDLGDYTDQLISKLLKDAETWAPIKINVTPTYAPTNIESVSDEN